MKLTDGTHSTPKYTESGVPFISVKDISTGKLDFSNCKYISEVEHLELYERCNPEFGDILLTKVGTTGIPVIVDTHEQFSLFVSVALLKFNNAELYNKYLLYMINSPLVQTQAAENTKGVGNKNWVMRDIANTLIVIPPLEEQHRIVTKIEELLPFIEKYAQTETQLTTLNTSFPEALKKSILQEAVQGRLVPQDPNDEPASVLLERIRAEKQALIKAGKIKKDKHESVIVTRDKIPYEIPDSWVWCKLSDLAILENGDRSSKYPVEADYVEIGIPFFGAKDIDGDMMSFQNVRFIPQQKYDELGNGKLVDGDIICLLRGSVGKTAKFEANEQFDTGFICAQMLIIRLLDKSLFGYISSYFKSPDYTNYVESKVTGTAVRQMPAKEMGNLLIPLPPLNEQHRIVAKIEELIKFCKLL